jgi:hypothetical protein
MARAISENKGFALVIAIGTLAVLMISGMALQSASFEETWRVRQTQVRTDARLALSAALEYALGDLKQGKIPNTAGGKDVLIPSPASERNPGLGYRVAGRETTAGEVGPALEGYPAAKRVVQAELIGHASYAGPVIPGSGVSDKSGRPTYSRAATVIFEADGENKVLLWMNHPVEEVVISGPTQ